MKVIKNKIMDEERALYGSQDLMVKDCRFDGPADGESALKESQNIRVADSYFNLRYPFWHDRGLRIGHSQLTENCRAAIWYSEDIVIEESQLDGIKALRECRHVTIRQTAIQSDELGWSVTGLDMSDSQIKGEYAFMRASHLRFKNVSLTGKYSFQYIEDAIFEDCQFDTKDAFWHGKNIVVKNSIVKGEYLAWYAENITFENCVIVGTQPLNYVKGLRLIDCQMIETDLAFEKSEVEATIVTPVESIKNPKSGMIQVPEVGELIMDDPLALGQVVISPQLALTS